MLEIMLMMEHLAYKPTRMDGRNERKAVMTVHLDLTKREEPFTVHSANVHFTSCPVSFPSEMACMMFVYISPNTSFDEDTGLLDLMRAMVAQTNEFTISGIFNFLDIRWDNQTGSAEEPGETILYWLLSHGLIWHVRRDTGHRVRQCIPPLASTIEKLTTKDHLGKSSHAAVKFLLLVSNGEPSRAFFTNRAIPILNRLLEYLVISSTVDRFK